MPTPEGSLLTPLRALPAIFVVIYLVACSLVWYGVQGSSWQASLGSHDAVVPLALLGLLGWWACIRASFGRPQSPDRTSIAVMLSSAIIFALLWYFGRRPAYNIWFGEPATQPPLAALGPFFYYASASVFLRFVLPLAVARATFGGRAHELGWAPPKLDRSTWIYVAAFLVALPAVAWASARPAFVSKYPLCKQAISDGTLSIWVFGIYQLAYAAVFVSGEAFWRGYIAFGLGRQYGLNALFFMLVPYVLGHFGKPQGEALGAVAAGLFLGYLALRHRSFWLGAAVHWLVALMMDLWAISRRGVEWIW